jgi:predicted nucleotidyltransferase
MRIASADHDSIKGAAQKHFGADCVVRLFGSRADDARRGGDIDIHVVVADDALATLLQKIEFLAQLEKLIGDRKVDLIVEGPGRKNGYIDRVARETGVLL